MMVSQAPPASGMFGREREMALGTRLIEDALAGRGALLLISGEAGIGKTALAEAIGAYAAARGVAVRVGRCYDLTETPPYGPWIELFAQFPPHGDTPLPTIVTRRTTPDGATSQATLFADVRDYLASAAAEQPLALLLDDLHWADAASLNLLHTFARQVGPLRLVLIVTYRDDELHSAHPLAHLLPALVRESKTVRLDLRRLDMEAARALVNARYPLTEPDAARLVGFLHDRTDGNPLFIGEMLRTLEEESVLVPQEDIWTLGNVSNVRVPALLRHVIDRRMARLDGEARRLLAQAALIGAAVPLPLWCAIARMNETDLLTVVERAVAARVLAESSIGTDVRFTHALIRQALYEATVPPQRRIWHRQVAEWLAAAAAPDPDAVGYHFRQAGDARAAEWLMHAGERAQRAYAWQGAIKRFEAAAALMEEHGADTRARGWLLIRLAWLRRFSDPKEGIASLDAAVRIALDARDDTLAAYARFYRGIVQFHRGDMRAGLAEMVGGMDALDAVTARGDARLDVPADIVVYAGDPRGTLVGFLAGAGQYAEAVRVGERIAMGAAPGVEVAHGLGIAYAALGQPDAAERAFARARAGYAAHGQYLSAGESAMDELRWTMLPYYADRLGERERLATEAEEEWARARGALDGLPPRLARLSLLLLEGNWDEGRTIALAGRSIGVFRNMARSVLGQLAYAQGESDLAWAVVREDLPHGPESAPGDTYFPTALILLRLAATLALDEGDVPLAHAWLTAHDRWIAWSGSIAGRADGMLGWAAYHRAAGDPVAAYEAATAALVQAVEPRQPLVLLAAHRQLGELDHDARRAAEAAVHLETALTLASACAAPYERALTLFALAATSSEAAETILLETQAIARTLGARPLLWRTDLQLGRHFHARKRYPEAERAYLAAQRIIAALAAKQSDARVRRQFFDRATATIPQAYRFQDEKPGDGGLTAREHEIVEQIAQGRSNREIGNMLFIAEKTVEMHVTNSLSKLGFRSRAQLAAWVVARDATRTTPPEDVQLP